MISIAQADRYHQLCRSPLLRYRSVDHSLFAAFCQRLSQLTRALGDIEVDDAWSQFLRLLRRYRFNLSAAPLDFNDPAVAPRMDENELRQFLAIAELTHPRIAGTARHLVDILFQLMDSPENPLLSTIGGFLRSTSYTHAGLVVAGKYLVQPTRAACSLCSIKGLEILTADTLRHEGVYDLLIVVGAPRWFPDHVFSAPRADHLEVVSYKWLLIPWQPAPTFLAPSVGNMVQFRVSGVNHNVFPVELQDNPTELDWALIEKRSASEIDTEGDVGEPDLVQSRLYALTGDYAVFLEATGRKAALVIDLDADEDDRVAQLADDSIEPGMFVVLRNDESSDYIVPMADKILGARAGSYRANHARWKKALRDRVLRDGLENVSQQIKADGSLRGDPTNLRNWISDRNIAPRDPSDFAAITRLVGMQDETDYLWQMAMSIRNAHLQAGVEIRRQLVEKVKAANLAELVTSGQMDFELPEVEGGRLTAFQIEDRAHSIALLPSARIERVFKAQDWSWRP